MPQMLASPRQGSEQRILLLWCLVQGGCQPLSVPETLFVSSLSGEIIQVSRC